ncbi:SDR family oxidoreductase [Olivibacter sp. XZL3]|uniref:SDR family oxidoreductase n=1 Tax=Olivibacter sp. XZL3 TaxID=1735116 RepID=UPI001065DF60|nr:SDR family oxidoreductase [Olivibacter sp. XZL3]
MKSTILITGASSGIGLATARHFSEKGWNVVATMRRPENQDNLKDNDHMLVLPLDVEKPETFDEVIATSIAKFGKIDVLLNNAGYGQHGLFEATPAEQIQRQFSVNFFGAVELTRAILPHFRKQQSGTIVTVSSGVGRVTVPLVSVYAASKFAAEGFFESLSFELSSQNIKVKLIEPGTISTNFEDTTRQNYAGGHDIGDYSAYLEKIDAVFKGIYNNSASASAEDVAAVIYEAATDNSVKLRYVVGDDLKPLFDIRNGGAPDETYMQVMRETFGG